MKYLLTVLMSLSLLAPAYSADQPKEKPKMMLAKKKDHSKDKPTATKKSDTKKSK